MDLKQSRGLTRETYISLNYHLQNGNLLLLLAIIFYLITAINSVGYHRADEHYQLIEFANYKKGWTTANKLAWEYHAQIRPGLQPFICYIVFSVCDWLKIYDGYDLALVLRLISAFFAIYSIKYFIKSHILLIDNCIRPFFVALSYLLWFLPFINVRFSSESWSGFVFLLVIAVIQADKNKGAIYRFFLIGVLMGLSILFRYQSCLLVFGVILWLIIIERLKIKHLFSLGIALLSTLVIGSLFDRWLYSSFTFTFYNYFYANIIKDVASIYGTAPWYEILRYIIASPGPLGIAIFASLICISVFQPKNIILWAIIPFLIAHAIIPHKELRFLFPLVNLVPLFLVLSFQFLRSKIYSYRITYRIILVVLTFFNTVGLLAISTTGASANITVTNYIHRNYRPRTFNVILNNDVNPYVDWHPPFNTFYDSEGINISRIDTFWQNDLLLLKRLGMTNLLVIREEDMTGPKTAALFKKYKLERVYQNIPRYLKAIYDWYDPALNDESIFVYEFK